MSKQPHEQDEKKASDGAQSAAAKSGAADNKTGAKQGNAGAASRSGTSNKPADARAASGVKATDAKAAEGKAADAKAAASGPKAGAEQQAAGSASAAAAQPQSAEMPRSPGGVSNGSGNTGNGGNSAGGGGNSGGGSKGSKSGKTALALVFLLAAGAAPFAWQAWQDLDAQQARIAELESAIGQLAGTADLSRLEERLETRLSEGERERDAALDEAIDRLQGEMASHRSELDGYRQEVNQALDHVLDELSSQQETDEREWLHAEAAYLLRLANQRLQLERDIEGATVLLRSADALLLEADNPTLLPVRREIASEIATLSAVPAVDRTGLWMALDAQRDQMAGQPLSQEIEELAARSGIEEVPSGTWQQQLSRFGQELRDLVVIRHHDADLEALIAPEQEAYLRQSVRLVLEQAQLALLKEEQALYEASIDKALALIEGYYDTSVSGVQAVISNLRELKGASIRPELPDISGSQQALATFIERRFELRGRNDA